jgi:L-methionine (R)-S-oxide reductase
MAHNRPNYGHDNAVGIITIKAPKKKRRADPTSLTLRQLAALISRKSVQIANLQNILHSRVTDTITTQHADYALTLGAAMSLSDQQLIAKFIAESVYGDMRHVGLSDNHIIYVASELISTLSSHLRMHKECSQNRDEIEDKCDNGSLRPT